MGTAGRTKDLPQGGKEDPAQGEVLTKGKEGLTEGTEVLAKGDFAKGEGALSQGEEGVAQTEEASGRRHASAGAPDRRAVAEVFGSNPRTGFQPRAMDDTPRVLAPRFLHGTW
jgi:hypothetical protein